MAKTKINLKHPYNKRWKKAYLNINSDGRRTLTLYNNEKDRSSTQYARYIMAVKIGRFLKDNEEVDHIDEDKTNDSIDNLQILTPLENNRKTHKLPDIDLICPVCRTEFKRSRTWLRGKFDRAANNEVCCSKKCGGKYGKHKEQKIIEITNHKEHIQNIMITAKQNMVKLI